MIVGYTRDHLRHDLLMLFMNELRDRDDLSGADRMQLYKELVAILDEERRIQEWMDSIEEARCRFQ